MFNLFYYFSIGLFWYLLLGLGHGAFGWAFWLIALAGAVVQLLRQRQQRNQPPRP